MRRGCSWAPLTPTTSARAFQACRAFTLERPVTFPLKFEWKRHGISGPAWAVGLSAVVLTSGRFAPVTRAWAQQANVS